MIPLLLILSTFVCASEPEFYVKTKQKVNGDWQFTLVNHGQITADCTIKANETCCCNDGNKNCECQAMRTKECHPKGRPPYFTLPTKECRP